MKEMLICNCTYKKRAKDQKVKSHYRNLCRKRMFPVNQMMDQGTRVSMGAKRQNQGPHSSLSLSSFTVLPLHFSVNSLV